MYMDMDMDMGMYMGMYNIHAPCAMCHVHVVVLVRGCVWAGGRMESDWTPEGSHCHVAPTRREAEEK